MSTTSTHRPSTVDRVPLLFTIVLGIAAAAYTLVRAVMRVVEVAANRDVPVVASFADTPATLPIGPGGAAVEVVAQEVVMRVSDMPAVTVVSLILAEVVYAGMIVVASVCGVLAVRNIIRGQAFSTANVILISTVTVTLGIGFVTHWLFKTMGANGGASALAGEPSVNTAFQFDIVTMFGIAALGALAAAFQVGNRIQRETEGLV